MAFDGNVVTVVVVDQPYRHTRKDGTEVFLHRAGKEGDAGGLYYLSKRVNRTRSVKALPPDFEIAELGGRAFVRKRRS